MQGRGKLGKECYRPLSAPHRALKRSRDLQVYRLVVRARALPLLLPVEETKVAIFVEPSPFSHVSGMRIRFTNLIKGLRELGNDVTVVTPCIAPPKEFCGAKVAFVPVVFTSSSSSTLDVKSASYLANSYNYLAHEFEYFLLYHQPHLTSLSWQQSQPEQVIQICPCR